MNDRAEQSPNDPLGALFRTVPKGRFAGWRKRWPWFAAALLALIAIIALTLSGRGVEGSYVTAEVAPGNLVVTVSASGTLQPTKSVDVGSELSGTLTAVLAQENDRVKKGQLLAELDPAKLRDSVARSRAALLSAQASVAQAQATVAEAKAALSRMRHVAELSGGKVPSRTEMESAEASVLRAVAGEASARAAVGQAEAVLKTDETNLGKGAIRSPVDGVVLTRKVEPGQSVVASMNIPVLFTLAEDLKKMELQIKVDEADVASVALGQPATFTVAAWPGRRFPATIERVGIGSTITDNVVTYKTVLAVANNDEALRPGMTASASIVTAKRENVLLVPNAALRFTPPQAETRNPGDSLVASLLPRPPRGPRKPSNANRSANPQVWVPGAPGPRAVPVKTGVTNGRMTEILEGELKPGMQVITDYRVAKK